MRKVGDKEAVYYGEAERTAGGLTKHDLMINAKGKIVSRAQHAAGVARGGFIGHFNGRQAPFHLPYGHLRKDLQR